MLNPHDLLEGNFEKRDGFVFLNEFLVGSGMSNSSFRGIFQRSKEARNKFVPFPVPFH